MNIPQNALSQTLSNQISAQESSIAQLQMQMATGQALNKPSDNPVAVTQVMTLSNQASQLTSWQNNADMAKSWQSTASSVSNNVLNELQSARTLLLQASNQGAQSSTSYQAIGSQLNGILSNIESLANTQYGGRAIFAGTSASLQAYDSSGNYLGNNDTPTVVVGPGTGVGQTVGISIPGTALFGVGSSNVFATLSNAVSALNSGSPSSSQLNTAITALDNNISTAQQANATLGNAALQTSDIAASLSTQLTNVQTNQSALENVNIATLSTKLASEMTNYQAALWAASKAIPETLQQFIP